MCDYTKLLPNEIVEYILSLVSPYHIRDCRPVCKRWRDIITDSLLPRKKQWFLSALREQNLKWDSHSVDTPGGIQGRYAHAMYRYGNFVYIFGGFTYDFNAFNDLWSMNLTTHAWSRMESTGDIPLPKAGCTMIQYKNKLVLLGGYAHTNFQPLHMPIAVQYRREWHFYDLMENRWEMKELDLGITGHSCSIHGHKMIVFGGLQDVNACHTVNSVNFCCWLREVHMNSVIVFDLKSYSYVQVEIDGPKPAPRIGHAHIKVDEKRILIMGGKLDEEVGTRFGDVWLLNMPSEAESTWYWQPIDLGMHASLLRDIWCHHIIMVDDLIVMFGATPQRDSYKNWHPRGPPPRDPKSTPQADYARYMQRHLNNFLARAKFDVRVEKEKEAIDPRLPTMIMKTMDISAVLERIDGEGNDVSVSGKGSYDGVYEIRDCPNDTILYGLVKGEGELIVFGGIQKRFLNPNNPSEAANNSAYVVTDGLRILKPGPKVMKA